MNRKKIVVVAIIVVIIISAVSVFQLLKFRITSISPRPPSVSLSEISKIVIDFNKPLDDNDAQRDKIIVSPNLIKTVDIDHKSIVIILNTDSIEFDSEITIDIRDISSTSGNKLSSHIVYKIEYRDFNKLPKDTQDKSIENSNSFENYSLAHQLPLIGNGYDIDYDFPDAGSNKMKIVITTKPTTPQPTDGDEQQWQKYIDEISQLQAAARYYIESLDGYSSDLYIFEYADHSINYD
jgi:hypothetical protein